MHIYYENEMKKVKVKRLDKEFFPTIVDDGNRRVINIESSFLDVFVSIITFPILFFLLCVHFLFRFLPFYLLLFFLCLIYPPFLHTQTMFLINYSSNFYLISSSDIF